MEAASVQGLDDEEGTKAEVDSEKGSPHGRASPTGKKEVKLIEANVTVTKKIKTIGKNDSLVKNRKMSDSASMYGGSRRSNYSGFTNKPLPFNALRFLA